MRVVSETGEIETLVSRDIVVTGRVQGVGFRPFVKRLAQRLGLVGWVRNHAGRVHILVRGRPDRLDRFTMDLIAQAPPFARPQLATVVPSCAAGFDGFSIVRQRRRRRPQRRGRAGPVHLRGMPRGNSRSLLAPTSLSVHQLHAVRPALHHRPRATLRSREYHDGRICVVWALPPGVRGPPRSSFSCRADRLSGLRAAIAVCRRRLAVSTVGNDDALAAAVIALRRGLTVAVKGIGGYHLLCDATCEAAVARLRRAKRRPHKPFAVMMATQPTNGEFALHRLAEIDAVEEAALLDPARPIVLVRKRPDCAARARGGAGSGERWSDAAVQPAASFAARRIRTTGGRHKRQHQRRAGADECGGRRTAIGTVL